jgi:hypothetical protein
LNPRTQGHSRKRYLASKQNIGQDACEVVKAANSEAALTGSFADEGDMSNLIENVVELFVISEGG